MSANVAELLERSARERPERPALVYEGTEVSYAEVQRRAARVGGLLRAQGVSPGDRVAILLPNSPAYVAAFYGALRIGAIVVPLNMLLRNAEIDPRLRGSTPRVLVTDPTRRPEVQEVAAGRGVDVVALEPDAASVEGAEPADEIVERGGDDTAVILYTSGTTGGPKGAMLTHAGVHWNSAAGRELFRLTPEDVLLGSAPFPHVFGQSLLMNGALLTGACVALMTRFEPASALALMTETETTLFGGVPTMFVALLGAAEDARELPPLRLAHAGGAPLPVETLRAFEQRFDCPVLEGYGLTESAGTATTNRLDKPRKPGSTGLPLPDTEIRIVSLEDEVLPAGESGEVQLRGPSVIREYTIDGETVAAVDADGWLATGDIGYLDEDGYLFLIDRKKDLIIRGGYNVYPREVEEVLYEHPDVFEASVVGIPDPTYGEEVVALVVPRPRSEIDPEAVKAFVRERVAGYKYPRHVVVVAELPKGPSGKILKREIDRDALAHSLAAAEPS